MLNFVKFHQICLTTTDDYFTSVNQTAASLFWMRSIPLNPWLHLFTSLAQQQSWVLPMWGTSLNQPGVKWQHAFPPQHCGSLITDPTPLPGLPCLCNTSFRQRFESELPILGTELETYMTKGIFVRKHKLQVITKGYQQKDAVSVLHSLIPRLHCRLRRPFHFPLGSRQRVHRYIKCRRVMILQWHLYLELTLG